MKRTLMALTAAFGLAVLATPATAADYGKREFKVVGTWGNLDHWKERERPLLAERRAGCLRRPR